MEIQLNLGATVNRMRGLFVIKTQLHCQIEDINIVANSDNHEQNDGKCKRS